VAWVKTPWFHEVSEASWHIWHVVGKPAERWLGLAACWYAVLWHPTHSLVVPAYTPPLWHEAHDSAAWRPTSGYVAWVKTLWFHEVSDAL
jgi:hypothetical protein